jgi:ABC-2 type transport system permease protein
MRILRVLLRKEFLQIRRDPVILRMLLVMPLIQLVILANAATFEVKRARLWVVDQDRAPASMALTERFLSTGRFVRAGNSATGNAGNDALMNGSADLVLVLPQGFDRDLTRERRASLQLLLNAENGSTAGVSQGYAQEIIGAYAAERAAALVATNREGRPIRDQPRVEISKRGWFNPTLNYKHFMVPGILVQLVVLVGTLMTALNIVREKEAGTLDQLNVTPIKPAVFLAAKLLPLWIIALFEFMAGMMIARGVFGVPLVGSAPLLLLSAAIFLLGALGVGLWVSTVAETQQQALFVTFALLLVYILMSGLFTPIRGMPDWVRTVAQVNPMLHFVAIVRGVMLRGAGFLDILPRLGALTLIGGTMLTLAVSQYHKRAE